MPEFIYIGDAQMLKKLKDVYQVSNKSTNNFKKIKKNTCMDHISFMFKRNCFQFPPKVGKYYGSNSHCGTNFLFQSFKIFKNVIGVLTWNGDEYFPSQTLTLLDLNRSDSIVHVLEITEEDMIPEKVIDFHLGDDFVVCQTESNELYFIGLNHLGGREGLNYFVSQISSEKIGRIEWVKCGVNKILIKSVAQQFYLAEIEKLNQCPSLKLVDILVNNPKAKVKEGYVGEKFSLFLGAAPGWTGREHIVNYNNHHSAILMVNKESLIADNQSFLVKDSSTSKHYLSHYIWGYQKTAVEDLIRNSLNETITIQKIIPNPSGNGFLVCISLEKGTKRFVMFGVEGETISLEEHLDLAHKELGTDIEYNVYHFPSCLYSETGFDKAFSFEKCHLTNDFVLFEMQSIQECKFSTNLASNTQYQDIDFVFTPQNM